MTPRFAPTSRSPRVRWVTVGLRFMCTAALAVGLGACNAVRHAPGDAEYAKSAVVDWVGDVVGAEPPDY